MCFINTVLCQKDTVSIYEMRHSFSKEEQVEWDNFEINWKTNHYPILKKKNAIKSLNCSNCESFYAHIYIEIDSTGALSKAHFKKGKNAAYQ